MGLRNHRRRRQEGFLPAPVYLVKGNLIDRLR